jgi:hypothetical protein
MQSVATVYNKWTRTTTVRNPLRAVRPQPLSDNKDYVGHLFNGSNKDQNCDFCTGKVAADPIGILSNKRIMVAANAFKLQDFHALFIPIKHNPLSLEYEDFRDLFSIAGDWFGKVQKVSSSGHSHPMLAWDSLPHAGASQLHTHMHGFMGRGHYLGQFRDLQEARDQYRYTYPGSDMTQDYINVHMALGLGERFGSNVILSPLDAKKDHEFIVIGPQVDKDFAKLVHGIHRTFIGNEP